MKIIRKILFICALSVSFSMMLMAQSNEKIVVKVLEGTINDVKPTSSIKEIMEAFPFYTGSTEENEVYNCGGGVFFLNHDFYAYTGKDYWEIRKSFTGEMDIPLFIMSVDEAKKNLGKVKKEFVNEYGTQYYFFKTKYGCCVLNVKNGQIAMLDLHWSKIKDVKLCY